MQDSLTDEDILYVEHALLNTLGSPLPSPSDDEEVFRQKSRATREDLKVINHLQIVCLVLAVYKLLVKSKIV